MCGTDILNGINVTVRTPSSFTALVTYNCSSINPSDLSVLFGTTNAVGCYIVRYISDSRKVSVTCNNIWNNAGRNWTFSLISHSVLNQTFTITLAPLSLNMYTNIVHDNLTSASIFIPNCDKICDPKYLVFRCNNSDLSNTPLSNDCTFTCFDLKPGSIYQTSLVRSALPIADKNNSIFEEEILNNTYRIGKNKTRFFLRFVVVLGLDTVTNLIFTESSTDKKTALIYFTRPHGYYDRIEIDCSGLDRDCSYERTYLMNSTGNCSECTFVSLSPIIRGVGYVCRARTIKEDFNPVPSDEMKFNTSE